MSGEVSTVPGATDRLSPERARQILRARFTAAGIDLTGDYAFESDDVRVTLEGYDAARNVGFVYLATPGDVADRETATEIAARVGRTASELAASGTVHILCVFEDDVPSSDVLERRIDAFFTSLPR